MEKMKYLVFTLFFNFILFDNYCISQNFNSLLLKLDTYIKCEDCSTINDSISKYYFLNMNDSSIDTLDSAIQKLENYKTKISANRTRKSKNCISTIFYLQALRESVNYTNYPKTVDLIDTFLLKIHKNEPDQLNKYGSFQLLITQLFESVELEKFYIYYTSSSTNNKSQLINSISNSKNMNKRSLFLTQAIRTEMDSNIIALLKNSNENIGKLK